MVKFLLQVLFRAVFRVQVEGADDVTKHHKVLIVANHLSFLDGLALWLFLPLNPTFVVHTEIKAHWLYRWLLKLVPHLAVAPNNPLAMKQIIKLVDSGQPVAIFPEGRITKTGSLMKIYDGSAFIAAKTGAAVIPVRLEGFLNTYFSRTGALFKRRFFPKLRMRVLSPQHISMPETGTARERRRQSGEALRKVMQTAIVDARITSTLFEAFLDRVEEFGRGYPIVEDIANLKNPGEPVKTYGMLLKMVLGLQRIVRKTTSVDENVGVFLPNVAANFGIVMALSSARRVPTMLHLNVSQDGLQTSCVTGSLKTIFTSRAFIEEAKLSAVVEGFTGANIVYLEDFKAGFGVGDKLWVLAHLLNPRRAIVPQDPESPAVILFTTGSESKPKGVVHSHRSILANIAQVKAVADFNPNDKFLVALPLFHSFGFTAGAMLPILSGYRALLYPSPLHYRVIPEVAYDRDCTVLFGTNTFLSNYARFAHAYDFSRLRYVIAGAEKLRDEVRDTWFERFGLRLMEGYGSTENAPVIAVNTPMAFRKGTVGQILPGIKYRLRAVPGIEVGGVLEVSGPNLMSGYLRFERPGILEAPKASGDAGWYDTADVVTIDKDGFVKIVDRYGRFANPAGELVSLTVVEGLAEAAAPGFAHAAVVIPDERTGEAIVVFTTDASLTRARLVEVAKERGLAAFNVPRSVQFIESIPIMGTGKTDYLKLKTLAMA